MHSNGKIQIYRLLTKQINPTPKKLTVFIKK
ncbi:MAG: hypothetical protein ACI8SA_002623, partial [Dokdonia sp.]